MSDRQAPIAKVMVSGEGFVAWTRLYSPGLPEGPHELYCEPDQNLLRVVRNEERNCFARKLYDLELLLGQAFHTVNNRNDCNVASAQLEEILERVSQMRGGYES